MKTIFLFASIIMTTPLLSIEDNTTKTSIITKDSKSFLIKKWNLNKITVNGNEDSDNYPINNDYYQFFSNGKSTFFEGTFNTKEYGTWILTNSRLIIKMKGETRTFIVDKLTNSELHLSVSTDDPVVKMYFSK